jgi:hypothetical protein
VLASSLANEQSGGKLPAESGTDHRAVAMAAQGRNGGEKQGLSTSARHIVLHAVPRENPIIDRKSGRLTRLELSI